MKIDLSQNLPHGSICWQLGEHALAELPNGEFMAPDCSIISGPLANEIRECIAAEGIQIDEEAFRRQAPPTLAQRLQAIHDRAARDPVYAAAFRRALAEQGPDEESAAERVFLHALRDAPEIEVRQLELECRGQNLGEQ